MSKQTSTVSNKIDDLISAAVDLALKEVERLARKIMKRNPKSVTCFCMGMGSATFYDELGTPIHDDYSKFSELYDFLGKHDRDLHLTGSPMKIEKKWDAPLQRDW